MSILNEELDARLREVYGCAVGLRVASKTKNDGHGRKMVDRAHWNLLVEALDRTEAVVQQILAGRDERLVAAGLEQELRA